MSRRAATDTTFRFRLTSRAGIGHITLGAPERSNALRVGDFEALGRTIRELDEDPDIRSIVLSGDGRNFCAGLDRDELAALSQLSPFDIRHELDRIAAAVLAIATIDTPVVTLVAGAAAGGGLALAVAGDVVVAEASARFVAPFTKIGLSGGDLGLSWLLPRLVGSARAHSILLVGATLSAREAVQMGLVAEVVPDGSGSSRCEALATVLASYDVSAVRSTKRLVRGSAGSPSLRQTIERENDAQALVLAARGSSARREDAG